MEVLDAKKASPIRTPLKPYLCTYRAPRPVCQQHCQPADFGRNAHFDSHTHVGLTNIHPLDEFFHCVAHDNILVGPVSSLDSPG